MLKTRQICVIILLLFTLISCSPGVKDKDIPKPIDFSKLAKESLINLPAQNTKPPQELLEPPLLFPEKLKGLGTLQETKIDIYLYDTTLKEIVHTLAKAAKMNVLLDDQVDSSLKLSVNFREMTAKEALNKLCRLTGYYYEVEGDTLLIKGTMTRYYELGFPKITSNPTISINGDVFSGGDMGGNSGISGKFDLNIANLENEDPYDNLKTMIESILTPGKGKITLNKEIGLVIVRAKKDVLDRIDKLIHKFQYFYSKQIEVEVTIIEVIYDTGTVTSINWDMVLPKIGQGLGMAFNTGGIKQGDLNTGDIKGGTITFKRGNEFTDLQIKDSVFNFLRQYGKVRVVASPKLRVTNGHSALVVMGEVRPYWKANKTVTDTDTNSTTTEYEENRYLKGTLLGIVAKATNDDTIYLQVTPMLSDILEEKTSSDGTQSAPVISMREASTLLKLHNNSIAILGGLKGKKTAHREAGTPYLMDTPGVGLLFKDKLKYEETSEIAMIIRARVVY